MTNERNFVVTLGEDGAKTREIECVNKYANITLLLRYLHPMLNGESTYYTKIGPVGLTNFIIKPTEDNINKITKMFGHYWNVTERSIVYQLGQKMETDICPFEKENLVCTRKRGHTGKHSLIERGVM